jgi:hypothetical protein
MSTHSITRSVGTDDRTLGIRKKQFALHPHFEAEQSKRTDLRASILGIFHQSLTEC